LSFLFSSNIAFRDDAITLMPTLAIAAYFSVSLMRRD